MGISCVQGARIKVNRSAAEDTVPSFLQRLGPELPGEVDFVFLVRCSINADYSEY